MTPDNQKKMDMLIQRVIALEAYVAEKKNNQITFPLDNASRQIVQQGTVVIGGGQVTAGAPFTNNGYFPLSINGKVYKFMTTA